jgi:hypothetical protein
MKTSNIFTEHPSQVRMTYLQHTCFALMVSRRTLACAAASLVHAIFPFLFTNHTSTTIRELNEIFDKRLREMPDDKGEPTSFRGK